MTTTAPVVNIVALRREMQIHINDYQKHAENIAKLAKSEMFLTPEIVQTLVNLSGAADGAKQVLGILDRNKDRQEDACWEIDHTLEVEMRRSESLGHVKVLFEASQFINGKW